MNPLMNPRPEGELSAEDRELEQKMLDAIAEAEDRLVRLREALASFRGTTAPIEAVGSTYSHLRVIDAVLLYIDDKGPFVNEEKMIADLVRGGLNRDKKKSRNTAVSTIKKSLNYFCEHGRKRGDKPLLIRKKGGVIGRA